MDGIFNVLKPPGMTSHDVVGALRKILHMKKIGHGGTLDPLAAGVLPVFTGMATRFLEYAAHEEKSYRAELTFGFQTDTGDTEGAVIAESPVRDLTAEEIEAALASFRGEGTQIPPMYSAISVGGTKLYKLARQGIEVKREPRPITLYELEKVDYTGKTLVFDVTCSKGTFIRTLCEDLAAKLGMKGTMSFLLRRRAGVFRLEDAHTLQEIAADPEGCCMGVEPILAGFPKKIVNALQGRRIAQGVATTLPGLTEGTLYQLWTRDGVLVGLARAVDGRLRAHKIIHIPDVETRTEEQP
ncbi:tRNA pseudouridine(55) synthase TruB [Acidaminococcus fermentans]|uniref:tRNA pseudouridine synthase B n=2 Tax=Acidaminococcus fermentans TaxID=905 RepID=D2RKW1_ACIFV|nr:tRNA pseudouridine(55) synthase TruB [Acidaminococcus fermentans]ADB47713.1 tRNA pseudouridine synthase B [Acidaminococcus fermentans DSM 20731]MDY4147831.1 tRNA pseudouridine(55) synthase TruB [Acidaminococcus fermentans]MEE0338770.1 tRNA pseudouridine(55) synthase TruB [Acidaminococcus fermentans]UEA71671.1 tRNA pseudouridine(55) synthase TruB [Acidaminococcus fermentans DSM 20731]